MIPNSDLLLMNSPNTPVRSGAPEVASMTRAEVIDLFRFAGYKTTPQRIAIFESLQSRSDHPNAERLFVEMKERFPSISRATIYNTLHVFKKIGLIRELGFDGAVSRYETNPSFHVNLVCDSCGKIVDLKDEDLQEAWEKMVSAIGIESKGQRLDLYHKCKECRGERQ